VETVHKPVPIEPNKVFRCFVDHQYEAGLDLFKSIREPMLEDRRWAGLCLAALGRSLEAYDHFLKLWSAKDLNSGPHLVQALRLSGEIDRAIQLARSIKASKLTVFAQACLERELGALGHTLGRLRTATEHFEKAYELAVADPIGQQLIASFAAGLGYALIELGRDRRANYFLERAGRSETSHYPYLFTATALAAINIGNFEDARHALDRARTLSEKMPAVKALLEYLEGHLANARGLNESAITSYLQAVEYSRQLDQPETECYAELCLSAVATSMDNLPFAKAHLARARALAEHLNHERIFAFIAWRHGALLTRANVEPSEALRNLELAREGFERLELERETGLVHLHLAEANLRFGTIEQANLHLSRAVEARHALGSGAAFAVDLRALPAVLEHLASEPVGPPGKERLPYKGQATRAHPGSLGSGRITDFLDDWKALEGVSPTQVSITSLGGYGLQLDGQPVKLTTGLARTIEVLTFLLRRGEASLEEIQTSVYTEILPERARGYIHTVREAVTKAIPGLLIPFHASTRTYSLRYPSLRLYWDALDVEQAISIQTLTGLQRALTMYRGPLLPKSDGIWVVEYRLELELALARAGLDHLEVLYKCNEMESCVALAERLLQVRATDVAIGMILVRAVNSVQGALAARSALERVKTGFLREVGEVPEELSRLMVDGFNLLN
jgi:hypothetical protein